MTGTVDDGQLCTVAPLRDALHGTPNRFGEPRTCRHFLIGIDFDALTP